MADPSVKIILSAVDKASAVINKTDKSLDSLGRTSKFSVGSITDLASGIAIAERVLKGAQQAIEQTVGVAVDYNKQIREMTQVTGLGAEEISRIVQVADDWGIEIGALRTSLGYMNKMGITPSIDNLAKLADEYVNTTDKAAFAEKAAKLLGRGYQTLIPILAKGGKALREQAAAIDDGLIATEESIKQAREYEVALDNWNDSVQALKISIGTGLIPALTELINLANSPNADSAAAVINQIFQGTFLESNASKAKRAADDLAAGLNRVFTATKDTDSILPQLDTNIRNTGKSIYITADNMERLEREAMNAGEGLDDLAKAAEKAETPVTNLLDGIDRDIASPIANFIKDLEWFQAGGGKLEAAFAALREGVESGVIPPDVGEKLAEELLVGATDLQLELDQIDATQASNNLRDTLGAEAARIAMQEIRGTDGIEGALQAIEATTWKINLEYVYHGTPPPGGWSNVTTGGHGRGVQEGGAHGLNMIVPPGFPNDSFTVGVTSGEHLQVTPAGQGGGGDVYLSFGDIVAPAGVDARAVAALVFRELQTKLVAAGRSGAYAAGG